mmetsp:Transcript_37576/g.78698  ORF Transcript_37576/g.78698 Transcript_37576/m.78698 type:complete len:102 (+) Transcript_37576:88-393(+)
MPSYFLNEVSTQAKGFPALDPAPSKTNGCPAHEFLNDFGFTTFPTLEWTLTGRSDSKRPTFDRTERLVRTFGIMVADRAGISSVSVIGIKVWSGLVGGWMG